jgi:hypothetical protein
MYELKPTTQRLLFERDEPDWNALSRASQQQLLEVLSQLLLEALERRGNDSITTKLKEDHHVS